MNTLLILEDDPDLRRALERLMHRQGYRTVGVGSVAEALARVETEEIDLILADIMLPDGSGLAFLRHLRDSGSQLPTILMTGLDDMSLAAEGMQAGASDFLTKPLDLAALRTALDEALQETRALESGTHLDRGRSPPARNRIVGRHPSIVSLFKSIGVAAFADSPVLIRGESGVGKELVAREIHHHSRPDEPFVAVNCASVPDSLIESVLFGHSEGAFTGATSDHRGHFALAGEGSLFLDEIGDASPAFQATLLRTIQEGEFLPVGSETPQMVGARIMAATNRSLEEGVTDGSFREDLYYRLQVIEMEIPPLRRRMSDLPRLCDHFLRRSAARMGWAPSTLTEGALERLRSHTWPGNVREVENVLERALINSRGGTVTESHIEIRGTPGSPLPRGAPESGPIEVGRGEERLDAVVYHHVRRVVEKVGGNKREAARRLGISPGRLYRILDTAPSSETD